MLYKVQNKKYNKKQIKKKIIAFLLFILIVFGVVKVNTKSIKSVSQNIIKCITNIKLIDYPIIKQDLNSNYAGIGQEKVDNKDGYFTTFTTVEENLKIYKEYKQNGNSSWSDNEYWDGTMADNGCGITAISIILSGYDFIYTPEYLRQKYYPSMNYSKIKEELHDNFNIEASDFCYDEKSLSKENIKNHLKTNRPVLICVWSKPTVNRWTKASHYMVLLATDDDNMVYISNPNGGENDSKSSGWYEYDEIIPYIASAIFINSY